MSPQQSRQPKKYINIILWTFQVVLAAMYLMAGIQKTFGDLNVIVQTIFWVGYVPAPLVRFVGISELLGAVGLILPAALKMKPWLTPLAATGIAVIMLLANIMHAVRGEFFVLPMTIPLFIVAVFVAYGRWKLSVIVDK